MNSRRMDKGKDTRKRAGRLPAKTRGGASRPGIARTLRQSTSASACANCAAYNRE